MCSDLVRIIEVITIECSLAKCSDILCTPLMKRTL